WLLHQTDWTNDVNCFFKWLSPIIEFSADGFRHAAIAEGLAQALMVCSYSLACIHVGLLVNPDSRPPDAEKVAKSFPQSFVSLSVICPMQLPKLRAIYNRVTRQ
ncbi:mediator of RNA polymerase II transcription subunit 25, partial [Tanacetum coccineum]